MKARALLKTEYQGHEMMRVNLSGRGVKDCSNKVSKLATEIGANYWIIEYNKSWGDLLCFRLRVGKNGITWWRK